MTNNRNNSDTSQILNENLASPCDFTLIVYFVSSILLFGIGFKITFFSNEEDLNSNKYWLIGPIFLLSSAILATQSLIYIKRKNANLLLENQTDYIQESIEPINNNSYQNLFSPPPYSNLNDFNINESNQINNLNQIDNLNQINNSDLINENSINQNAQNRNQYSIRQNLINNPLTVDLPPAYSDIINSNIK